MPSSNRFWPDEATALKLRGIILAAVDTDADAIESWNRWYDLEHLPPNIALPGIASGRRYVATPELVAARLPEEPLSGFENGKGLHITIYLTDGDPVEAIGVMTERREDLEFAGRMDGAGNRVVRAGDAMHLSWTVSDPKLLLDEDDVAHTGHRAIRIVMRRGGDPVGTRATAEAAVAQSGVHGVVSYSAQFQAGLECDIYLLEDSAADTISGLRSNAPYPADAQILLDAPFDLITPLDYGFAERIRGSSLPQTIA
jgi:hypothetical protein